MELSIKNGTFIAQHIGKTEQVVRIRGQYCGDVELVGYLANTSGPVPLVLDLLIAHDRFGSNSDPNLNGTLHYPNDIDRSLNETVTEKIRKYRADYNNNPPNTISFMSAIARTSGRLHSEFIRLLFLQVHRETDRFFAASGVQSAQFDRGFFHFHRAAFSSILKSKCGNILVKAAALRINLNLDGAVPITSQSPIAFTDFSSINLVSIFRCSSSTTNPVYVRSVNYLVLVCSLSSHRHSYIPFISNSRLIDS